MSQYVKLIRSGTDVETWSYEKAPNPQRLEVARKRGRRISSNVRRSDNIAKCRDSFRRLVRSNLKLDNPPGLCTLTFRDVVDISAGYRAYTEFVHKIRRIFGEQVSLIAVPEFQKRGSVHFHVLMFDFPYERIATERSTRYFARLWGHGFVDVVQTDGSPKLSTYLAKYMSKAMHDSRLSGKRAYSATRNVLRPVSLNRPHEIVWAYREWELSTPSSLVRSREYDTLFLGRCVYKQHLIT